MAWPKGLSIMNKEDFGIFFKFVTNIDSCDQEMVNEPYDYEKYFKHL